MSLRHKMIPNINLGAKNITYWHKHLTKQKMTQPLIKEEAVRIDADTTRCHKKMKQCKEMGHELPPRWPLKRTTGKEGWLDWLTNSQVRVDTGIPCRPRQVLVFPVRNMLMCPTVSVFLRQSKVNYVDKVSLLTEAHEKVIWLYIAMNKVLTMDVFNPIDQLIGKKQHCLQLEFPSAKVEQIFKAGSQELHNHDIVFSFGASPFHDRYSNWRKGENRSLM